jgi:hypothetical protein
VNSKDVDEIIKELERIRKWRRERGDLFFDAVLEASKSIKERYGKWYEKAISELYAEVEMMNNLVPFEELDKLKSDLMVLRERFNENKKNLDDFVIALEKGEIKSFAELSLSGTNRSEEYPPSILAPQERSRSFSVVLDALNIAKQVEEMEKKVEKMSKFMTNVILLTKRLS